MWSHNQVNRWSACLTFTFPIKQNQDINTSILKTVQTLQCLIQVLARIWILMCPWLIRGVRTSLGGLARKMVMLPGQEKKENEKMFRRACSRRICIKMCSSCDRTFWEVGRKGREFLQHLSQQSVNPEANFNASMFMSCWRKRFSTILQRCNAKVILKNFQNCHLVMVI